MRTPTTSELSSSNRRTVIWYGFTIFISSAILLVLEIVAGRLIAPYVGVSIYSWTSIIGVILAGLSLGNWVGGRWADRGGTDEAIGITLLLAAIFCIASLMLLTFVAPVLQTSQLDLISSSFIYVLTMFFLPAMLLGIITPLLTTMALHLDIRTGHIVGRMHALAALGSILGTFITGYWLVQYFGTRMIIIGSAICLALLALPFLRKTRTTHVVLLITLGVSTIMLTQVRNGFANPCQWESNYFCVRVVDASSYEYGAAKALILDHLLHGINHKQKPDLLISPYVHAMDEIVRIHFKLQNEDSRLRYFFAGGGAYTQPRAIFARYPNAHITVAELDPQVTSAAEQELFVNTSSMHVIHNDARVALQSIRDSYDVIITDVFHDVSVPYHMITQEFAKIVKRKLHPQGMYLINIVDIYPDAKLVKSLINTLQLEFNHVDVWLEEEPEQHLRVTYVISANNFRPLPQEVKSKHGFDRQWRRVNKNLSSSGTPLANLPILTDDFVPVERLLAGVLFGPDGL